jgi:hypothetical protein
MFEVLVKMKLSFEEHMSGKNATDVSVNFRVVFHLNVFGRGQSARALIFLLFAAHLYHTGNAQEAQAHSCDP